MNEQLQERVFSWVSTTAEKIGDFAGKEIPPFITEYLTWKFWESAIGIGSYLIMVVIFSLVVFALYKLVKYLFKKSNEFPKCDYDIAGQMVSIFGGVGSIGCLIAIIFHFPIQNVLDCVKIKIAPKVYLVEKAAELYKEAKK